MDTDLFLSIGVLLLVLSLPSLLSAWVEGRAPRIGALMILLATGLIVSALMIRPGGYSFDEVPDVMIGVVSRWFG